MTEMEKLEEAINAAKTGADIRMPLVDAFTYLFETGRDVGTIETHPASYFAKQDDMNRLIPFDNWTTQPKIISEKLVAGGVIFNFIGDADASILRVREIIAHGKQN